MSEMLRKIKHLYIQKFSLYFTFGQSVIEYSPCTIALKLSFLYFKIYYLLGNFFHNMFGEFPFSSKSFVSREPFSIDIYPAF